MVQTDGLASMYRLTILGDGGVGKTALTIQLCLNQFVETYDPTIEDSYRKRIILDGEPTTLEVLDTAGQEEYTALRDQWIRDGEGFLIVYSITHRPSFAHVLPYYQQILRVKDGEPFGCVLVGNKVDKAEERQVSIQEGEKLANELGIAFFETSAKLNINAEHAFLTAAQSTRESRANEMDDDGGAINGVETSTAESLRSSPSLLPPSQSNSNTTMELANGEIPSGRLSNANSPKVLGHGNQNIAAGTVNNLDLGPSMPTVPEQKRLPSSTESQPRQLSSVTKTGSITTQQTMTEKKKKTKKGLKKKAKCVIM